MRVGICQRLQRDTTTSKSNTLEIFSSEVFEDDFFLRLELQELQDEADEFARLIMPSECPADIVQIGSSVNNSHGCQCETVLFPVLAVPDTLSDDLLDEELQVQGACQRCRRRDAISV